MTQEHVHVGVLGGMCVWVASQSKCVWACDNIFSKVVSPYWLLAVQLGIGWHSCHSCPTLSWLAKVHRCFVQVGPVGNIFKPGVAAVRLFLTFPPPIPPTVLACSMGSVNLCLLLVNDFPYLVQVLTRRRYPPLGCCLLQRGCHGWRPHQFCQPRMLS